MLLRIFVEPQQGARYADILAAARLSEELGFDGFFRSDHFLRMGTRMSGDPGPTDAWTTLAGLARETTTIRLGTLVSSATFRHPGLLAVQVAQVDDMSSGRVELGIGTGWFEPEHRALGVPFPARRFDLLEEQLEILQHWWSTPAGETFSHHGPNYDLVDSPALPKPHQPHLPVIVGGLGATRTPALAARFAAEFNLPFPALADIPAAFARADAACHDIGRSLASLRRSVALVGLIGANETSFARRAEAIGRDTAELRRTSVAGTVPEAVERTQAIAAAGAEVLYLQIWDLHDLDHLALIAETLLPPALGAL